VFTRRFAAAAVLSVLVVTAVAGCRSDPTIAAYVGDQTYDTARVEQLYDEARRSQADPSASPSPQAEPTPTPAAQPATALVSRQQIVAALVGRDVAAAVAAEKGVAKIAVDPANVARVLGIPPKAEYATVYADFLGYVEALVRASNATTPSDADVQDVMDRLVAAELAQPLSLEEARNSFGPANLSVIARAAEVRDQLEAQAAKSNVVINPRYAPADLGLIEVPDQQGRPYPLILVRLDADSPTPAVVDQT
jgi:hypothetical protein